jgi:DNA-binding CsgD family transcriptional regulator
MGCIPAASYRKRGALVMKKSDWSKMGWSIFCTILFVLNGSLVFANHSEKAVLRLEDFAHATVEMKSQNTSWKIADDRSQNGNSAISWSWTEGSEGKRAIKIGYELGTNYQFPYVLFKLPFQIPLDVSEYKSLSFWVEGSDRKLKVQIGTADIMDYDYHNYQLSRVSPEWRRYKIPFNAFKQDGWGTKINLDLSNIILVQFQINSSKPGQKGWFKLDKIEFSTEEVSNPMHNKEHPEVLSLENFKEKDFSVEWMDGEWKAEDDSISKGRSQAKLSWEEENSNTNTSLSLDYELKEGFEHPYCSAVLKFDNPMDISAYNLLSFRVRGTENKAKIVFGTGEVTDYDYYSCEIGAIRKEWKEYRVLVNDLSQEGWGNPAPLNLSNVKTIQFRIDSEASCGKGTLEIDNVCLTKTNVVFKNYPVVKKDALDNGCFLGVYGKNYSQDMNALRQLERKVGKKFAQVMWFVDWKDNFPLNKCENLWKEGYLPHITLESSEILEGKDGLLDQILVGKWDKTIQRWAESSKNYKKPYFLRWGHEFNVAYNPWSIPANGMDPKKFSRAYRYIHNSFIEAGATNVLWVWSVNHINVPNHISNDIFEAYPGDDVVDWVAIDGFNFGTLPDNSKVWNSFDNLFSTVYTSIVQKIAGKPLMLGGVASVEMAGNKADWIKEAIVPLKEKYPALKSIIWFNTKQEVDWRLDSSPKIALAFHDAVSASYFLSSAKNLLKVGENVADEREIYLDRLSLINPFWEKKIRTVYALSKPLSTDVDLSEWSKERAFLEMNPERSMSKDNRDDKLNAAVLQNWQEKALFLGEEETNGNPHFNPFKFDNALHGKGMGFIYEVYPKSKHGKLLFASNDSQILARILLERKEMPPYSWNYMRSMLGKGYVKVKRTNQGYNLELNLSFNVTNASEIEKISLVVDNTPFYQNLFLGITAYTVVSAGLWFYFRRKKKPMPFFVQRRFLGKSSEMAITLNKSIFQKFGLSLREIEILDLLIQGFSYNDIGAQLFISPVTVKTHVIHIYQKTGVKNKVELILLLQKIK